MHVGRTTAALKRKDGSCENKSLPGPLFYQTCGEAIVSDDFGTEMIGCLPRLRRFALALTGAPDTADDLVQETCLKALSRADQFQQGSRMDSWMFKIAQNVWLDKMRSNTARGQHMTMEEAPVLTDAAGEIVAACLVDHGGIPRK